MPSQVTRDPRMEKRSSKSGLAPVLYMNAPARIAAPAALEPSKVESYLNRAFSYLKKYSVPALTVVRTKRTGTNDADEQAENVLMSLARSIEAKDPYMEGHGDRLSQYAIGLGESMRLGGTQIRSLRIAGVLHDIGKVAVPDEILMKPGPLTSTERAVVEQHPLIGEQICAPLKSFSAVLPIIRHHHERFDGTGYPDGLSGEAIPLTARIVQVVDIYDALTTHRPYRQAMAKRDAFRLMRSEGARGWLDTNLLGKFERIV